MTDKQSQRDKLRAEAPELATFVDDMRAAFGADQAKVTYLRVGEQEFGKPSPEGVKIDIENRIAGDDPNRSLDRNRRR